MAYLERKLPEIGELVGTKYRLIRRIGEGGMGVVFEALHERIRQRVAIKMLLPEVLAIDDVVSRFEREARAAGQLRSENAARVLDVDVSQSGIPFMVMEFLDGNDLSVVLEARLQLPIAEAVDYVLQACNAMAEAHAAGIIHRDLKPSNLFLCGGDRPVVKVLDFGISKIENDKETRVTATQTTVGTPLYMSPEQIRSAKHVDSRTDIWSLGIILYELLAGKTPFEGSTAAAAAAICIDEPPPMSVFRHDVPRELEQVILGALAKKASERYADVHSLAAAIAPFGSGQTRMSTMLGPSPPSMSRPSLSNAGREELVSARTLAAPSEASAKHARPNPNVTVPGWTTRSSTTKTKSRTLVVALGAAFSVVLLGVVGVVVLVKHDTPKPATIASVTPSQTPTATAPTASTPATAIASVAPKAPASVTTSVKPPVTTGAPPIRTSTPVVKPSASAKPPTSNPTPSSTSAPIHL